MQKRLLSALLTLCLVLALLPTATIAANATSVHLGAVTLNGSTPYWRNGQGSASSTADGYNAYFDVGSGTLTLRDAIVTTAWASGNDRSGIEAEGHLDIVLVGSSRIGGASLNAVNGVSYGVYAQSIQITGDGELIVTGGNATGTGGKSYGLYVNYYFLMGSGTVTANTISTSSGQAMNVEPAYYDRCANGGCLVKAGADQASASLVAYPVPPATYTGNKYVKIQTPPRAGTPNTTFSFDGANAGKLLGTTAQMKYSLDGGATWMPCTAPSTDLSGALGSISKDNDIQVKDVGDGVTTGESLVQRLDITQATVPNLSATLPSTPGESGSIPMTAAHEYRLVSDVGWTAATGTTSVAVGSYLVRVRATGTTLASVAQSISIYVYIPPAATPSVTFSFDGTNAGRLLGTTTRMKYSLDGGSLWIGCAAPSTDLSGLLGAISQVNDLRIKDMGNGVSTTESQVQIIDITKAITPTASKVDCSTLANNDGRLTGVTTAMEYKLSTAGSWASGTGNDITGLRNGTYHVRVKATGTVLASDAQTVVINAYVGTPAATPSATFSFDGADAGKLLGTTARMTYSTDGGSTWKACAASSTDLSGIVGSISETSELKIKDLGDGVSTTESQVQIIDITKASTPTAGKVDCSTLANNDGKLTGVTTAMEYRLSSVGYWTGGTGSDITGLANGIYQVRVKAAGTVQASDVQTLTINDFGGTPAERPNTTFSFDGTNAGRLLGTTTRMKYSLDGGSLWIACSAPSTDLSGLLGAISQVNDLRIKDMGNGVSTTESQVQIIDITKAITPTASKVDCSTLANNDGKLTGVTTAMEYKLSTAGYWISGTGSDITGLANGIYQVRVKATGTVLASDAQTVVINAYVGTPAATPSATFSFDGADAGKLLGTTARMTYSTDGGSTWKACAASSTDLSGIVGSISETSELKIKDLGDGVSTTESQVQIIDITKASTPTASKVDCSTLANNDGKLTGVTTAMEYKLSTAGSWASGTGNDITGLRNGTYHVRVKATGTVLASDVQSLIINAYVGTPATTPSATFSFDGANAGSLFGTTAQMKYSLDGGNIWFACTAPSTVPAGTIGKDRDIRVKDMGDGVNTTESQVQTIDITQAAAPTTAGKADCSTLANNDGKLTGVTTAMEYWSYTDGTWVSGTGSDITGLQSRTYYVRVKATGTVLASDPQLVSINAYVGTPATTPSAIFSFDGSDAGKLLGTTTQMVCSLDGGHNWARCTAPSTNLSGALGSIRTDHDIKVKDLGDGVTTTESAVQTIDITQAEVPTADKVDCTTLANNDGKLTGVTTAMEYRLSSAGYWTSGTGSDITGLANGIYHVRVKATGTVQASDVQTLTISDFGGTPAERPNTTFSFDGSDAGKLLGTTTRMKYSLDGGSLWIACSAPSTDLSGLLGAISQVNDLRIKDMGNGVSTTESQVQIIDITKAITPTAGKVDCTTLANDDGQLTDVTTAMEYKLSTAGSWASGTGSDITGLSNGTYHVRVKATGTTLASDAQTVVINAYVGTPATEPIASFSFDGANAGQLLGTTDQMRYSLDGGNTWVACTAPGTDLSSVVGSISETNDIKVKDMGDGITTIESAVQAIDVTRAVKPTLVATQPSTIGGNGSIPLTTDHEYRLSDAIDWISANGATSLVPGSYLVRVKATGTVLASDAQSITLTAFTGNPESTPAAVVDYAAEKLTNLMVEGSYALDGTDTSADDEGKLAIDNDWFGTTISLVKKGDGVTTNDSEAQSLVLAARPAAPVCTATQPSASAATGTVSGITSEMQYSTDNGTSWIDGTGSAVTGLVPGTVLVRVKATNSAPASRNQTLTITAYIAPPSDEESGGSSGGSGNPVPAPVTEISSGGSTTSSNLSQLISTDKTLTVSGDDGAKLVFDTDALKGITGQTSDGIIVELREVSPEHQDNHPGKRVFTLTVSSGGKTISEFGGSVTVTLPYALKDGEQPADVTVWYLADDGTMTEVSCAYDPVTGLATFQVSHFSRYVVGTVLEETVPQDVHFSDVLEDHWFHGAVQYVAGKGLMGATSGAAFSPQSNTTRSLLVTILWRLEHEPKATTTATFSDVLPGESYAEAVAWGAENALVGGYSASRFGPDDSITREQLAVFLYRYAKYKGVDVSARDDLSVFKDKPSTWARSSVQWAVAQGLLRGNGSSDFLDPTGGATRAQLAAILQRFIENVLK